MLSGFFKSSCGIFSNFYEIILPSLRTSETIFLAVYWPLFYLINVSCGLVTGFLRDMDLLIITFVQVIAWAVRINELRLLIQVETCSLVGRRALVGSTPTARVMVTTDLPRIF